MVQFIERALANDALIDSGLVGDDLGKAVNAICSVPVADVAPVVHGDWIWEEPNSANRFRGCFLCNKCFESMYTKKNFCSNCGARMKFEGGKIYAVKTSQRL